MLKKVHHVCLGNHLSIPTKLYRPVGAIDRDRDSGLRDQAKSTCTRRLNECVLRPVHCTRQTANTNTSGYNFQICKVELILRFPHYLLPAFRHEGCFQCDHHRVTERGDVEAGSVQRSIAFGTKVPAISYIPSSSTNTDLYMYKYWSLPMLQIVAVHIHKHQ